MGLGTSKSKEIDEQEKEITLQIEEWLVLRNNTIAELLRVADELDSLHKKATYSKLAGGLAGALGGGLALGGLVFSLFTGGTSLLLTGTGLSLAAGGGVTATAAEVVETVTKKIRVDAAQKALEKDKTAQTALLSKIETSIDKISIDTDQKGRLRHNLRLFVEGIHKIWVSGAYIYSWAKSGQAIYTTVKWAQTGTSIWKVGAKVGLKRTLMSVGGGIAGSVFLLVDLGYVIHHAIHMNRGTPLDAAKSIRDVCKLLEEERDKIMVLANSH